MQNRVIGKNIKLETLKDKFIDFGKGRQSLIRGTTRSGWHEKREEKVSKSQQDQPGIREFQGKQTTDEGQLSYSVNTGAEMGPEDFKRFCSGLWFSFVFDTSSKSI